MALVEYSIWIKASPEDVWRVYADPLRIPEWQTGSPVITEVQGDGTGVNATYVSRRGPGVARTTVVAADPPHHLVTRTQAYLGLRLDVVSRLQPDADGTRLHVRGQTYWPRGLRVLGKAVERAILSPREANKELANLKSLVERDAEEHR